MRARSEGADYWIWKSAEKTGGSRHVRYVCNSADEIAIGKEVLPNTGNDSFSATQTALRNLGYNNANRKYLVYADWVDPSACGYGEIYDDHQKAQTNRNNSGDMFATVYIGNSNCSAWSKIAMHELGHMMGGVQKTAPRHDDKNVWHPRDEYDRMAYGANTYISSNCSDTVNDKRWDCNNNDYFHTNPASSNYLYSYWNTAANRFLVGSATLLN